MMYFDHCYLKIKTSAEYFALGDRGFNVTDTMVEHGNRELCRFIMFKRRDVNSGRYTQYLEFVELSDLAATTAAYPMGATQEQIWEPGFSLISSGKLKAFFESKRLLLEKFKPEFLHKNYDWKNDNTSELPGWNFLSFDNPVLPGIYV